MVAIIEKAKANRLLQATIEYLEATQLAAINRLRLTGGIGHEEMKPPEDLLEQKDGLGVFLNPAPGLGSQLLGVNPDLGEGPGAPDRRSRRHLPDPAPALPARRHVLARAFLGPDFRPPLPGRSCNVALCPLPSARYP